MNAAKHDRGAAPTSLAADRIATTCRARVDSDPHDIARFDAVKVERLERFVRNDGVSPLAGGCLGQHKEPSRGDDRDSKR